MDYLNRAEDKNEFKSLTQDYIRRIKNKESFDVDITDDHDRRLAFLQALRSIQHDHEFLNRSFVKVSKIDINGEVRPHVFVITSNRNVEDMIRSLNQEIVEEDFVNFSGDRYNIQSANPLHIESRHTNVDQELGREQIRSMN